MCERYYINTELRIISRNINNYFINYGNRKKLDRMTGSGGWIISYIAENYNRDVFQRDLEKEFDITRSTASKNVDLLVENGFIIDLSNTKNTTQLVFELSTIMDHPDVKGKRVCLKLGNQDLKQSPQTQKNYHNRCAE